MRLPQLILAFTASIFLIFAGNALAQTDININNTSLFRFGGSVTVPENQVVENAHAFGGSVTVSPNARVLDTAIAFGGNIILKAGARVDGDAYSFGGKIIQEPGATIGGERATFNDRHGMISDSYGRHRFFPWYFFNAMFRISSAVVATILGLIILQTSPQFLPDLAAKLRQSPGLIALWGFGAIVSIVFAVVFLAISLIGIPLIPILSLSTVVASLVGSLGVALFVGQSVNHNGKLQIIQQFLLGLVILTVLTLLPFLGGLVVFLINLFGLGVILLWQFNRSKPPLAV